MKSNSSKFFFASFSVTFVCKTILNLTFEDHLQNTAEGYYVKPVKFGRRSKIPRIRFVKTLGADGLAAQIVSQPLQFQAFRGNDFQKQVTFSLNFKVSGRRRKSKNFMLLLTDECARRQSGVNKQWKPSISLSFQPSSRTFRLLFRTEKKVIEEDIKGAKPVSEIANRKTHSLAHGNNKNPDQSGPEVIKPFSCSTQMSMKFKVFI